MPLAKHHFKVLQCIGKELNSAVLEDIAIAARAMEIQTKRKMGCA